MRVMSDLEVSAGRIRMYTYFNREMSISTDKDHNWYPVLFHPAASTDPTYPIMMHEEIS